MKHAKRIASLLLALVMAFALGITAFAEGETKSSTEDATGSITISNPQENVTYTAYKIFTVTYDDAHENYSYTISTKNGDNDNPWFNVVKNYTGATKDKNGTWIGNESKVTDDDGEETGAYSGNGLTLTPAAGDPTTYVVTPTSETKDNDGNKSTKNLSAPDFAEYLLSQITVDANTGAATIGGSTVTGVSFEDVKDNNDKIIAKKAESLPLGYYLVAGVVKTTSENGTTTTYAKQALAELNTTQPNVTIYDKNEVPSLDKTIVVGDNETDYNNAAIGDTVNYKVTSKVPDMTGYTKYYFVVTDTLSKGLTLTMTGEEGNKVPDVTIKIGDDTLSACTHTGNDAEHTKCYTATATENDDGTTTLEIVFKNFIQYNTEAYVGKDIVITYTATVNENAVIGTAGNPNSVKLIYSNNPNVQDDGDPDNPDKPGEGSPVGETPESKTYTYVTDVQIIKVDQDGNRLAGATFKLEGTALNTVLVQTETFTEDENGEYWKLKDGSYTTTDPSTGGVDSAQYESTTTKYTKTVTTNKVTKTENVTYTGTTGADGVLTFSGLSAGTYTITEITAPDGYNLLDYQITLVIEWAAPTAPSTDCTWTYKFYKGTGDDKTEITGNGVNQQVITVENQSGTLLPSTGGMGTTIFYIIGSILVVGAVVVLVARKRMTAENEA